VKEGWLGSDYLILFSAEEQASATERYGIAAAVPDHTIVGLRSWDDFIVLDATGGIFTIPTVPMDAQYKQKYVLPANPPLQLDARMSGKIKWYVKPLAFGGDPKSKPNLTWVSHEDHAKLVVFWNRQYRNLQAPN
jgi:hypothetical protein